MIRNETHLTNNTLTMIEIDKIKKRDLEQTCASHFVNKLYLFGSATSDRFDKERETIEVILKYNLFKQDSE